MKQASTREVLQDLAEQPIGSPELQKQPLDSRGNVKPEVKEAAKRATKIWLPQGKLRHPRGACNEPAAQQIDIEDAVEAAGGKRGNKRSA